jgi:hypothetical protein
MRIVTEMPVRLPEFEVIVKSAEERRRLAMEQYLKHVREHQCLPTRTDPEIPATHHG